MDRQKVVLKIAKKFLERHLAESFLVEYLAIPGNFSEISFFLFLRIPDPVDCFCLQIITNLDIFFTIFFDLIQFFTVR